MFFILWAYREAAKSSAVGGLRIGWIDVFGAHRDVGWRGSAFCELCVFCEMRGGHHPGTTSMSTAAMMSDVTMLVQASPSITKAMLSVRNDPMVPRRYKYHQV